MRAECATWRKRGWLECVPCVCGVTLRGGTCCAAHCLRGCIVLPIALCAVVGWCWRWARCRLLPMMPVLLSYVVRDVVGKGAKVTRLGLGAVPGGVGTLRGASGIGERGAAGGRLVGGSRATLRDVSGGGSTLILERLSGTSAGTRRGWGGRATVVRTRVN